MNITYKHDFKLFYITYAYKYISMYNLHSLGYTYLCKNIFSLISHDHTN